jgi:hypothetical protein
MAVARFAGLRDKFFRTWGSAALHSRLYSIARYRGLRAEIAPLSITRNRNPL